MMKEFWPAAWQVESLLASGPADERETTLALEMLQASPVHQYFIFVYRKFADPGWFDAFYKFGLLDSPFPSQPGWPASSYLARVASQRPKEVTDLLIKSMSTQVPAQVATAALQVALELPAPQARRALPVLLAGWDSSGGWLSHEVLSKILAGSVSLLEPSDRIIAVGRIVRRGLGSPHDGYSLTRLLDSATADLSPARKGFLADGVELGLAWTSLTTTLYSYKLLDHDAPEVRDSDSVSAALSLWLSVVAEEMKRDRSDQLSARTGRLINQQSPLLQGMGLRALRLALECRRPDPGAIRILDEIMRGIGTMPFQGNTFEVRRLIASAWELASVESRAGLLSELVRQGTDTDKEERLRAFRWLGGLKDILGPSEMVLLRRLTEEFGPNQTIDPSTSLEFEVVGPKSVLSDSNIEDMDVDELVEWMAFPRTGSRDSWSEPSAEGLGRQIQPEVARRPADFVARLSEIAHVVREPSIHVHVIQGLASAFKVETARSEEVLTRILDYLAAVVSLPQIQGDEWASQDHVAGAAADFLEAVGDWIATVKPPLVDVVRRILLAALGSSDPTPEHEREFGGTNMDPPTLALNAIRGKGLRATVDILSHTWNITADEHLARALNELVIERAKEEPSPSIRSVFGLYLPWLLERVPAEDVDLQELLLPVSEEQRDAWIATFTTYLLFRSASQVGLSTLLPHYLLAIERLNPSQPGFLDEHADRLIAHLISFWLVGDNELGETRTVVLALARASDQARATAMRSLAQALERNSVEVEEERVTNLIQKRIEVAGESEDQIDSHEAEALIELLFARRASVTRTMPLVSLLLRSKPSPDLADLLVYLDAVDSRRSKTGARLFAAIVRAVAVQPWIDIDPVRDLIHQYTQSAPDTMNELVNELGTDGWFQLEEEARALASLGESEKRQR